LSENQKAPVHKTDKPWGYELLWAKTGQYVGKVLFVKKGEALSLQTIEKKKKPSSSNPVNAGLKPVPMKESSPKPCIDQGMYFIFHQRPSTA